MSLRSILAAFLARFTPPTAIEDKTLPPTEEGTYTVATMRRGTNIPIKIRRIRGELIVVACDGWADAVGVEAFWRAYEVTSWEVRKG